MTARPRLLRYLPLGVACAAAASAVTACSSNTSATRRTTSEPQTTTAARSVIANPTRPNAATDPLGVPNTAFDTKKPITGPAIGRWGQASVQDAYREAVNFTFREGWNPTLMHTKRANLTPTDYADAARYMTKNCAISFDKNVARSRADDTKTSTLLESVSYVELTGPNNSKLITGSNAITGKTFTSASASVDKSSGVDRLALGFQASAIVRTQDAQGKVYAIPTHRKVTFWLVRNSGGDAAIVPWLIDGIKSYQWSDKPR